MAEVGVKSNAEGTTSFVAYVVLTRHVARDLWTSRVSELPVMTGGNWRQSRSWR